MKALQEEREEKLIKILRNRLEPYVKGQKDDFVESAKLEVHHLSQAGMCCCAAFFSERVFNF